MKIRQFFLCAFAKCGTQKPTIFKAGMNGQITILDKPSLRRMVSQLKAQMSPDEKARQSDSVFAQVEQLQQFNDTRTIVAYWSLDDEVQTQRFVEKWYRKKRIFLPVVVDDDLIFKQFIGMADMRKGAFGILEPTGAALTDISSIDLVIVPGVAFDAQNNRMGRGRGFYDRALQQSGAFKIGVAFNCQIFKQIPTIETDIPMDLVING